MLFVFQPSVYRRILVIVPYCVRLEVLTAVWMKSRMFWNLMPYRLVSYRLERTLLLHHKNLSFNAVNDVIAVYCENLKGP